MLTVEQLARLIRPERTVLFLGAGASVPSGGQTGNQLAASISQELAAEPISEDLMEASSILVNRYGRSALVGAVRNRVGDLQPTGGMLALPSYNWHSIFTTNFDEVIERSYKRANKPYVVVQSNFDFGRTEGTPGTRIFKIHGSVTHDFIDGNNFGMVLTESDYEGAENYREAIYRTLDVDLLTKDLLIIGYSLRDNDLRSSIIKAAELQQNRRTTSQLYALVYTPDQDRATLIERRGIQVAFSGIDTFISNLVGQNTLQAQSQVLTADGRVSLPVTLATTVTEVSQARMLPPDAVRLYHGSAATYSDINSGLTFSRSIEGQLLQQMEMPEKPIAVILGVEGVGKTTLSRRTLINLLSQDFLAWEHRADFPFFARPWIEIEKQLRERGLRGVLFVDDCTSHLGQVSALCDSLESRDDPALRLVVAATASEWQPRIKTSAIFRQGVIYKLSLLTETEITELVGLLQREPSIRNLVDQSFSQQSRQDQIAHLRHRCSADMYVCLKNIFANEELDSILLREYARLRVDIQDVYRHVAVLQAAGARVHRQLVIRLLEIEADTVMSLLKLSEGIIEEYDIDPSNGIYGWSTRHDVIARIITEYKYSDQDELYNVLRRLIEGIVPTIDIEIRTMRDICNRNYGIGRLNDVDRQIELYSRLNEIAPKERVPRHRLISALIHDGRIELAAHAIREAEEVVGMDAPIHRYKVRLSIRRAQLTPGLMDSDRIAMLRQAETLAKAGLTRYRNDKWAYMVYGDVGLALRDMSGDTSVLDDAIVQISAATERVLDPQLLENLRRLENQRNRGQRF